MAAEIRKDETRDVDTERVDVEVVLDCGDATGAKGVTGNFWA